MKYGIIVGLALIGGGCAVQEEAPIRYPVYGCYWYSPWDACIWSSWVFDQQGHRDGRGHSHDRHEAGKVVQKMYDRSSPPSTTFNDSSRSESSGFSESSDSSSKKSHESSRDRDREGSSEKRESRRR